MVRSSPIADPAKTRVLHLVRALDVGGLERVVLDLLAGLRERGVSCHIGCLVAPGSQIEQAVVDGRWIADGEGRGRLQAILDLSRYVTRNGIDMIHSHNPQPHLHAVGAGLVSGVGVIHTKHGRNYPDNPRAVWLNRQLARCSTHVVAVSRDAARVATDTERVTALKVRVVHNGVRTRSYRRDPAVAERMRMQHGVPAKSLVIGSVGRLSREKRYDLLVEAFALFLRSAAAAGAGPTAGACKSLPRLVIVGDGPDRPTIEDAIASHGVSAHVILAGMSDRVVDWLQMMDVFSLSSRTEGTSITLLEAAACSLPLVVTDVGGNREIVRNGQSGALVPFGDVDAMAAQFERLAGQEGLRARWGAEARAVVEAEYSVDRMVAQYASLYREGLRFGSARLCLLRSVLG